MIIRQKYFHILFLLAGFIFSTEFIYSQEERFSIEEIPIDRQVPNNSIITIIQDSHGFLWLGTKLGIFRFDGNKSEKIFSLKPGNEHIKCLFKDKNSNIWAGTKRTLIKWDEAEKIFFEYDIRSKLPKDFTGDSEIEKIYEDNTGNLILIFGGAIAKFNPKDEKFDFFPLTNNPYSISTSLLLNSELFIFVGQNSLILDIDNIKQSTINAYNESLSTNKMAPAYNIEQIIPFREGYSIVGLKKGLKYCNITNGFAVVSEHPSKSLQSISKDVLMIHLDRNGNYWFITKQGRLYYYNIKSDKLLDLYNSQNTLSPYYSAANCIFEDYSGNIFIGLRNGYVQKISRIEPDVKFYSINSNSSDDLKEAVTSMTEDKFHNLWIGTNKRILSFNGKSFKSEISADKFSSPKGLILIKPMRFSDNGTLWFANSSILCKKSNGKIIEVRNFTKGNTHKADFIKDFLFVGNNVLVITSKIFLLSEKGEIIKAIELPNNQHPLSIFRYLDGSLFVKSASEMFLLNPVSLSITSCKIITDEKVSHSPNQTIKFNSNFKGWLNSSQGLFSVIRKDSTSELIFKKEKLSRFLDQESINNFLIDDYNKLWMTNIQNGLWKYDPETKFLKYINIHNINPDNIFRIFSSYKHSNGRLVFGSMNGIFVIDPINDVKKNGAGKFVITRFNSSDMDYDFDYIDHHKEISLPMNTGSFCVEYSLLDYIDYQGNRYHCKLEGHDTSWVDMGNVTVKNYYNLDGGNYTLKLRALNSNGYPASDTLQLKIQVPTPLYKTWYAILGYILFTALVTFSISRYRLIQNQKKLERLKAHSRSYIEYQEAERSRISKELHDSVNQVLSYAKMRLSSLHDFTEKDVIKDLLQIEKLLDDTNLEIRRISHNLHPIILDDLGLQGGLTNIVRLTKERHKFDIDFSYLNLPPKLNKDLQINIYRIIQEALNNIIKHSDAKKCSISISNTQNAIHLKIEDDGIGFEIKDPDNFKSSFGLRNMKERTGFFNGKFEIQSSPGKGTKINITIPYSNIANESRNN